MPDLIRVSTNAARMKRWLDNMAKDQTPFAVALALTRLAAEARDRQRAAMPKRFEIRAKYVLKGIQSTRANKRDTPILAEVGTRDEFIAQHEEGGTIRAKGSRFAIPTKVVRRRRTASGRIPASLKVRPLLASDRAFKARKAKGEQVELKRIRKKTQGGLRILAFLRASKVLKPRLELRKTVLDTAKREYPRIFKESLERAVRTARG